MLESAYINTILQKKLCRKILFDDGMYCSIWSPKYSQDNVLENLYRRQCKPRQDKGKEATWTVNLAQFVMICHGLYTLGTMLTEHRQCCDS